MVVLDEDVAQVVDRHLVHLGTQQASSETTLVMHLQVVLYLVLLLIQLQQIRLVSLGLPQLVESRRHHVFEAELPHQFEQVDCEAAHLAVFFWVKAVCWGLC